jgi:hypothetical protein
VKEYSRGSAATENRNISRKGTKHVVSDVEGTAQESNSELGVLSALARVNPQFQDLLFEPQAILVGASVLRRGVSKQRRFAGSVWLWSDSGVQHSTDISVLVLDAASLGDLAPRLPYVRSLAFRVNPGPGIWIWHR